MAVSEPSDPDSELQKGGKGGEEGGEPPALPLSNAAFLESVMRGVPDGAAAAICTKKGDPSTGGWRAEAAADVEAQCPPTSNNYINCSSFTVDEVGAVEARKERFAAYHFLLLDDVGTKVDPNKLAGLKVTWEIETSPGNSQIGIAFSTPVTDQSAVRRMQEAVSAAGLNDPGAAGVARWARLPLAINGKAKYHDAKGEPFACRMIQWNPEVTYELSELADALGLAIDRPRTDRLLPSSGGGDGAGNGVYTPAPAQNPVLQALKTAGLYKREIEPGKHDITCPWVAEHTDALDTGAAYFEPDVDHPGGGFKCQHSHGDQYRLKHLLAYLGVDADQARGKAQIVVRPGEMNQVRRAAEQSLAAHGDFYQAGGAIVVIRRNPGNGDVHTELLGEAPLTSALSDAADWYRIDAGSGKPVRTDPSPKHVQALLRAGEYPYLPALSGIARNPFFREDDGQLVTRAGYDQRSGRYAAFDGRHFDLPEPSEANARAALADLNNLLGEFRFATSEDRSAAICAMLTAVVRPSLSTAPAFNITASTPGSGKSYLAATIAPLAGPGVAHKISYPTSADEASKSMLSTFLSAPAVVIFDDMQTDWIPHGALNRMLTSDTMTDRVLGISRTVTVSTRSLILGTGNNVAPVRDMVRRVVTIRLHHKVATPALETYVARPAEMVAANRAKYVTACLTIIAAYRAAGSPKSQVPSIASFDDWSDLCRQPLLWLGEPDPAASIIEQLAHDPAQDELGQLLGAWFAAVGDRPITVRDLIVEAGESSDLEEALLDPPVVERDVINRNKLGWYLKRNKDRVVGGFELQDAKSSERKAWRVIRVEPDADTQT